MLLPYSIVLLASAFGAVSMANPITDAEAVPAALNDVEEWGSNSGGLVARQSAVRCTAVIGLGNANTPTTCGSINYLPNKATGFNPLDSRFPNCNIVTEIAYPNCNQYRVVSVTNCGSQRRIDIRDPSQGC